MDNLPEVLEFTKEHNVTFTIISEGGEYLVLATLDRVAARYTIDPNDPSTLAEPSGQPSDQSKAELSFIQFADTLRGLILAKALPKSWRKRRRKPK